MQMPLATDADAARHRFRQCSPQVQMLLATNADGARYRCRCCLPQMQMLLATDSDAVGARHIQTRPRYEN